MQYKMYHTSSLKLGALINNGKLAGMNSAYCSAFNILIELSLWRLLYCW